jgi:hypothetical protein
LFIPPTPQLNLLCNRLAVHNSFVPEFHEFGPDAKLRGMDDLKFDAGIHQFTQSFIPTPIAWHCPQMNSMVPATYAEVAGTNQPTGSASESQPLKLDRLIELTLKLE